MAKIQKITRMKHPGVLRDFTWPADLAGFGRFNLIYGWNGSGKTTLSRLFRHLELRSVPQNGLATLATEGTELRSHDFPNATVTIRVFNRDFVNESVFPVGGGDVPPIFVVGKDSVDKQKEVEQLKGEKLVRESDLNQAHANRKKAERELDKHCVDRAKVIKDSLRVSGPSAYNEYDKRAYRNKVDQMAAAQNVESYRLDETTRNNLLLQHHATERARVQEVVYKPPLMKQLHEEVAALRTNNVVASVIQELKDDPPRGNWTREGLLLHKERESQVCLYCEQTLPIDRQAALEAHFSAEYSRFLQRVDELRGQLETIARDTAGVSLPDKAALYDDLGVKYETTALSFRQELAKLHEFAKTLIQSLEEKREQPFKSLGLDVSVPEMNSDFVNNFNEVIQQHNERCTDFKSRTIKARDLLATDIVAESLNDYMRLAAAASKARDSIAPIESDIQNLTQGIEGLERDIVEHRQPAEELNDDLRNYLGHGELHLEVKETGYEFMRNGVPADSLSEGERTALALLYFLKSLDDREFSLTEGVVVLDDPVSSLDENSIYLAFGYIRQRTQNAAQLFLLTHNFTLFRQVRNWFHNLRGQRRNQVDRRPARFYMLDQVLDSETRCTALRPLDPLLEQYESEYHYLFARVYRERSAAADTTLEYLYDLPNIGRRLLETFLAFRRPHVPGELWKKLQETQFDQSKKLRIIRFVHTHSHSDRIGDPEHDPSLLGEARSVLDDILAFIKAEDAGHFEAMVEVVESTDESDDEE